MSARQPLAALMKIVELGHAPRSRNPLDAVAATELRKLLSHPLAPLSQLDNRERRKITDRRLEGFAAALAEVQPAWIGEYAASAAVALPLRERRLREFMLHELFLSQRRPAQMLALLTKHLRKLPRAQRMSILTGLLGGIAKLPDMFEPAAFEDFAPALNALIETTQAPTSPKAFLQLAVHVARAAEKLSNGVLRLLSDGVQDPAGAVLAHLDEAHRGFLLRSRWGALAPEINAVLWHRLWQNWREAASPASPEPTQQSLLKEAAWSEADQAIARALQDAGRLGRSLDKLETATSGEAGARVTSTRGASNLVLQWVRQAARLRNLECLGTFGDSTAFDPVFHDSHDAALGDRVRILKPAIVRANGSQRSVILRGEVERE